MLKVNGMINRYGSVGLIDCDRIDRQPKDEWMGATGSLGGASHGLAMLVIGSTQQIWVWVDSLLYCR